MTARAQNMLFSFRKSRFAVFSVPITYLFLVDKSKKMQISPFAVLKKKHVNLTIDLSSLGLYAPGPHVLTCRPKFCAMFESELRSGPGTES